MTEHKSRNGKLRRVIDRYRNGFSLSDLTVLAMQSDPYRFDVEARYPGCIGARLFGTYFASACGKRGSNYRAQTGS